MMSSTLGANFVLGSLILQLAWDSVIAQPTEARFLGVRDRHNGPLGSRGPADLLAELEQLQRIEDFDHELVTSARVERLEAALLPMFRIAPKDSSGRLDANAARYALHRLFSDRHGWFVNGIELQGGIQANSSKVGEALLGGGRFTLRQLARFAATLETLVHVENMERLQQAFDVYGFTKQHPRTDANALKVIEAYLVFFVGSYAPANSSFARRKLIVERGYPAWADTKVFAEEIRKKIFEADEEGGKPLTLWESCLRVVEEIGERYGRWQNKDCLDLKSVLLSIETPGTGRVPLSSFWGPLLNKSRQWMFDESLPYLEQLGALEGSEAPHQSVVIPNYLYSSGNCLASSKYYDVCCINECEELLGRIENEIDAPTAEPERLAAVVASLSSSSVEGPRVLPAALVQRLNDIAAHHQGVVQLHGRLFFQFMHHAFPHECPYPRLSVSKHVERNETWIRRQTPEARVAKHVVAQYAQQAAQTDGAATNELPWTDEEDLFMHSLWFENGAGKTSTMEASLKVPLLALLLAGAVAAYKMQKPLTKTCLPGGRGFAKSHSYSV